MKTLMPIRLTPMKALEHTDCIEFPNGMGFTPCTTEYRAVYDEMNIIKPDHIRMDDLSPEDYEAWNLLQDKLGGMQINGHVSKSVRY